MRTKLVGVRLMAGQQTLNLYVEVRLLHPQLINTPAKGVFIYTKQCCYDKIYLGIFINTMKSTLKPFTRSIRIYLFVITFLSGMTSLAVEFAASRLLGNVFGTSNIVWASIIGLILIYLTVGYWLGGKLADRSPTIETLLLVLLWAGFTVGLVPIISRPVLSVSANAFDQLEIPVLFGSFTAVLILFSIPVTLLGVASPFVLKLLLTDTGKTGGVAGKISAISTLGSFLGTFVTVIVLIPLVGTYRTFLILSLTMIAAIFSGFLLVKQYKYFLIYFWMPLTIIVLLIIGVRGTDKKTQGLIYETESAYNYIQVLQQGDYRFLRLNEGQGVHSIYHPTNYFYSGPWSQVLVAPYFNPSPYEPSQVNRIAILGLAAGTTARQASVAYPEAKVDGFEIDPEIIRVGEAYFSMSLPNLSPIAEDARWGITKNQHLYDIISIDAYKPPYIPAHMITIEFFRVVRSHLSPGGVMVINVGRSPLDRDLVDALATTINQVFSKVFITDIPDSFNTMIFASNNVDASWDNFVQNMDHLEDIHASEILIEASKLALLGKVAGYETSRIFTDDLAPIEWMTNKIVLDYVFSEEVTNLE